MTNTFKRISPHLIVPFLFVIVALAYFGPVLSGKKLQQSDIVQFSGMSRQVVDFRKQNDEEPYWLDNAFVGMPTYQVSTLYPHDHVRKLDRIIRFLPRPADMLFLYLIGFYVLLLVLRVDWRVALIGALAFGFSTYMVILLGIGHNSKAIAIGYMPLVLAGIILAFRGRHWKGFFLTTLALALNINANHYQMTYYLLLLVLVLGIVHLIEAIKNKTFPTFLKTVGILAIAAVLAVAMNATKLLATQEYTKFSTRGASELTIGPDGSPKASTSGLSKEYITDYSYGIAESLNLFAARLFGGSSSEALTKDSNAYEELVNGMNIPPRQASDIIQNLPMYWADQPFIGAPAYVGAIVIFLFVLGIFLVKGKLKYWLVAGTIVSLLLSWGKNLAPLTNFMIDHFPLYDKFRAVSSIQVILELCIPALGVVGLSKLLSDTITKEEKLKALKWSAIIVGGIAISLLLFKGAFSFTGPNDAYYSENVFGFELMEAIKDDRRSMYTSDLLRSLALVMLSAAILFAFLRGKLKENIALLCLGALVVFDLVTVDRRYVNTEGFVSARMHDKPFQANKADLEILKDQERYRVYEPAVGVSNARTSYFHNAIGGYHGAKPAALQELYDFQIAKNNLQVLNMLNVRYVIRPDEQGQPLALTNPEANGDVWFVDELVVVPTADDVMRALDTLNTKRSAVTDTRFADPGVQRFVNDSAATIQLTSYQPNHLVYEASSSKDGQFAVFSEMYYENGWNAYIDASPRPHIKVNHLLRGMQIPKGVHIIEFKFEPEVIERGSAITIIGYGIFVIALLFFVCKRLNYETTH